MLSSRSEIRSVDICLAGLGMRLICTDAEFAKQLEARYSAFVKPCEHHAELKIHLQKSPGTSSWHQISPRFEERRLYFSEDPAAGSFEFSESSGWLELVSPQPVEELDYALRVIYAFLAFYAGGLLLHAAGIVRRGQAYLFLGASGSGKTTVARLSKGDLILNDDMVLLMPGEGGWKACSTPFWNPTQVKPAALEAGIVRMVRLVQDRHLYLEAVSSAQALAEVIACVPVIPAVPQFIAGTIQRCQSLLATIPFARLHFLLDASFWTLIDVPDQQQGIEQSFSRDNP